MVNWRYAIVPVLMACTACGGGGGGGGTTSVPVAIAAGKNPVLTSYTSNTVQAALPGVPDGTPVSFTSQSPNVTLIPLQGTVTGGQAAARVKSSLAGKFPVTVTATVGATVYTGTTKLTFLSQPSHVALYIALAPAVTNLGAFRVDVLNGPGISVLENYSTNSGLLATTNPDPGLPPAGNRTTVAAISAVGVTTTADERLFRLTYGIAANGGLPGFSVDPTSLQAAHADLSPVTPQPGVLLDWKYDTDTF
jgi:hypothetical protein